MSECGKKPYKSKAEARHSVRHMHETVRVYKCDECPGIWHTTQQRYSNKAHQRSRSWHGQGRYKKKGR